MKTYTHLVFDIDGTLLNTEQAVLHSLQWALGRQGIALRTEDLRFALGIPGKDALRRFQLDHPEQVLREWDAKYTEFLQEVTIFDGIIELLGTLRDHGIALGVVTSKTQIELAQDFSALGLDQYFELIVTADDTVGHKPDPEPMLNYLKRSGAKPKPRFISAMPTTICNVRCAPDAIVRWLDGGGTTGRPQPRPGFCRKSAMC